MMGFTSLMNDLGTVLQSMEEPPPPPLEVPPLFEQPITYTQAMARQNTRSDFIMLAFVK
jgi:hypothetical protein